MAHYEGFGEVDAEWVVLFSLFVKCTVIESTIGQENPGETIFFVFVAYSIRSNFFPIPFQSSVTVALSSNFYT